MMQCRILFALVTISAAGLIEYNPYDNPETKLQAFTDDANSTEDLLIAMYPKTISLKGHPFLRGVKELEDEYSCGTTMKRRRGLRVAICLGKGICTQELDRWHVRGEDLPVAMLFPHRREDHPKGRYRLDLKDVTDPLADLRSFVDRYDSGQLKPYVLSQPAPEQQYGPVTEVVGSTFKEEVLDKNVTTLMLFYYPWCGYSKMVKSFVREVGNRLGSANSMLRVAQMDTSSNGNEVPAWINVDRSYAPRLYLFRSGNMTNPELLVEPVLLAEGNDTAKALAVVEARVPGLNLSAFGSDAAEVASGLLEDL